VTIVVERACLDGDESGGMPAAGSGAPDAAAVSVRDQGDGIAPDVAPRVFRNYWHGRRSRGTGLGLYIVKGLVEAHGGTIDVQCAPGGGAEFRFIVPPGPLPFKDVARCAQPPADGKLRLRCAAAAAASPG
jgi:signal transduction histidine kinase